MDNGGGGGVGTSCLMGFADNCNNINRSSVSGDNNNNNIGSPCLPPPPHPHSHVIYNNSVIFSTHNHHTNCGAANSASSMMLQDNNNNNSNINDGGAGLAFISSSSVKAKIMSHPHYPRLLSAYLNCQKVIRDRLPKREHIVRRNPDIGAPPEVVERLEEACRASVMAAMSASSGSGSGGGGTSTTTVGQDPALDQFMEAYCEMLIKYEQELSKPFKEAMIFLSRIESQFKAISFTPSDSGCGEGGIDRNGGSSEEDVDVDVNNNMVDPQAEERELKGQLLRKYSGYLGSLKQEFMKKRKKGKLPKEARQQLLDWWTRHYKWPYPSEAQKLALAESTGLDQKQINNWFINQRKRHWKPSEDMQFVVMDAAHPHYYIDNIFGNPYPMDMSLL